jgi:hypothetical protein
MFFYIIGKNPNIGRQNSGSTGQEDGLVRR